MNIGTVVEGPSDRLVLEAILDRLCPGEPRYFRLQPTETFGQTGTGWKGVRRWCRETWRRPGSSLEKILSGAAGPPLDLLIIQVDAEVAAETDLQEGNETIIAGIQQPCPPIQLTIDKLGQVIQTGWLKKDKRPAQVILAIPAQDIEHWTFAALFPDDELCRRADYECMKKGATRQKHPGYRLTLKKYGKHLSRKDNKVQKSGRQYRKLAPRVAADWEAVCGRCSQARQFDQDIRNFLASRTTFEQD